MQRALTVTAEELERVMRRRRTKDSRSALQLEQVAEVLDGRGYYQIPRMLRRIAREHRRIRARLRRRSK